MTVDTQSHIMLVQFVRSTLRQKNRNSSTPYSVQLAAQTTLYIKNFTYKRWNATVDLGYRELIQFLRCDHMNKIVGHTDQLSLSIPTYLFVFM